MTTPAEEELNKQLLELFDLVIREVDMPGMPKVAVFPIYGDKPLKFAKKLLLAQQQGLLEDLLPQMSTEDYGSWVREKIVDELSHIKGELGEVQDAAK